MVFAFRISHTESLMVRCPLDSAWTVPGCLCSRMRCRKAQPRASPPTERSTLHLWLSNVAPSASRLESVYLYCTKPGVAFARLAGPMHLHLTLTTAIHGSFQRTNQSQDHRVRVFRKTFTSADADHNVGGCLTNLAHRNFGAWKAMVRPRCEKSHFSDHAELTVSFTPAFKKMITKCPQLPHTSNRRTLELLFLL
jgi:hypothetical protein